MKNYNIVNKSVSILVLFVSLIFVATFVGCFGKTEEEVTREKIQTEAQTAQEKKANIETAVTEAASKINPYYLTNYFEFICAPLGIIEIEDSIMQKKLGCIAYWALVEIDKKRKRDSSWEKEWEIQLLICDAWNNPEDPDSWQYGRNPYTERELPDFSRASIENRFTAFQIIKNYRDTIVGDQIKIELSKKPPVNINTKELNASKRSAINFAIRELIRLRWSNESQRGMQYARGWKWDENKKISIFSEVIEATVPETGFAYSIVGGWFSEVNEEGANRYMQWRAVVSYIGPPSEEGYTDVRNWKLFALKVIEDPLAKPE